MRLRKPFYAAFLSLMPALACAHAEIGVAGGLQSGLLHPVYGIDHLVAMVAVGLWGAQLGKPAVWLLPIAFPMLMAVGALAGILGVPLPGVELGIALSALLLGALVALSIRASLTLAIVVVSAFALFHGHAHGTELPAAVNALAYGTGFVLSTGLLHLCGVLLGLGLRSPAGAIAVRASGGAIALVGGYFVLGAIGWLA